jgi:2',3'-cyclic-nucleotide 2'-phosphodiesterase (5'-nucleotidase family)
MLKTNNFQRARAASVFCLTIAVLTAISGRAVVAQSPADVTSTSSKASQTTVDGGIPDDPNVDKMLEPYSGKVRALDSVIGKLDNELKKGGLGGGTLGNFVTDGMRAEAAAILGQPIDLVVTNSGGLRKASIAPGDLRVLDIFELLPFENKLVVLELSGEQLLQVLRVVISSREPQAGARVTYRINADKKPELDSVTLIAVTGQEKPIDPAATYRVVTIDYLLSVSGGNFAMLHEAKSTKPLGITIRDAIIEYVKAETAAGRSIKGKLDGRFVGDKLPVTEAPQ